MGGFGDFTDGAVVNEVNGIRLECRPPGMLGDVIPG